MRISVPCYVPKIPNYYRCYGNGDRVLFVLIVAITLFDELTVNWWQLCKLYLFDCVILLSYLWRVFNKKVVTLATSISKSTECFFFEKLTVAQHIR